MKDSPVCGPIGCRRSVEQQGAQKYRFAFAGEALGLTVLGDGRLNLGTPQDT